MVLLRPFLVCQGDAVLVSCDVDIAASFPQGVTSISMMQSFPPSTQRHFLRVVIPKPFRFRAGCTGSPNLVCAFIVLICKNLHTLRESALFIVCIWKSLHTLRESAPFIVEEFAYPKVSAPFIFSCLCHQSVASLEVGSSVLI